MSYNYAIQRRIQHGAIEGYIHILLKKKLFYNSILIYLYSCYTVLSIYFNHYKPCFSTFVYRTDYTIQRKTPQPFSTVWKLITPFRKLMSEKHSQLATTIVSFWIRHFTSIHIPMYSAIEFSIHLTIPLSITLFIHFLLFHVCNYFILKGSVGIWYNMDNVYICC